MLGPLLLAVQLVRAAGAPAQQLRGAVVSSTLMLAQNTGATRSRTATNSTPSTSPISAILYTKGEAKVSWKGSEFAVNNGSYAYIGGETIQMAAGSIGLLQLSDGGRVFVCGGSTVSLARTPGGAHLLTVTRGSSRFSFTANSDFSVRANDTEVRPVSSGAGSNDSLFEGEVSARADGGCLVCELARNLHVSATGADAPTAPSGGSGRIFEVGPARQAQGRRSISAQAIPAAAMPASMNSVASAGAAFQCQCEQLKLKTDELAIDTAAKAARADAPNGDDVQAPPGSTQAAPEQQQAPLAELAVADAAAVLTPPVAPPEAPPVALAEPGVPDPFDPNVLPPPAAGEPTDPIVIVAPPLVPSSGSGGGGIASPS